MENEKREEFNPQLLFPTTLIYDIARWPEVTFLIFDSGW